MEMTFKSAGVEHIAGESYIVGIFSKSWSQSEPVYIWLLKRKSGLAMRRLQVIVFGEVCDKGHGHTHVDARPDGDGQDSEEERSSGAGAGVVKVPFSHRFVSLHEGRRTKTKIAHVDMFWKGL